MNFQPELAEAVMAGLKTVTRRLASDNPQSTWYVHGCKLKVGRDYAVCPGRGKPAIGRIIVRHLSLERLRRLSPDEARREGFAGPASFELAWRAINGTYYPDALVWRVQFGVWPEVE